MKIISFQSVKSKESSYLRSSRSGEHQIGPSDSSKRQGIAQILTAFGYKETGQHEGVLTGPPEVIPHHL